MFERGGGGHGKRFDIKVLFGCDTFICPSHVTLPTLLNPRSSLVRSRRGGTVTVVTPSQLRYSCNSGNVPGPQIILQVELLTLFTSGLPFLLCSSFVLTLLIRNHRLVVLLFCSIVLRSQTYLRSEFRTPCYVPILVIMLVVPHNRLIIFPFRRYIHSHGYIYEQMMYDRISSYIDHSAPISANL